MASLFQSRYNEIEKYREKSNLKLTVTIIPAIISYSEKILEIKKAKNSLKDNESKNEKVSENLKKAKTKSDDNEVKKLEVKLL